MKVSEMSRKTKEEHAAFLLKFSNSLILAFIITITIAPMGMIIGHIVEGNVQKTSWLQISTVIASWQGIAFIALEALAAFLSLYTRNQAYMIYNTLYPDSDA
ncbi:hypothetical protein KFE80_07305 [bacterium SCSIO 12696]|nr:hypothetical protein KFE80_07305 [bacterium SCSIO 12696]